LKWFLVKFGFGFGWRVGVDMGGYEMGWSGVEVENLIAMRCPLAPLIV
jgi:hypothetical protein